MEVIKTEDWAVINIQEQGNVEEIMKALMLAYNLKQEYHASKVNLKFSGLGRIYSRKKFLEVTEYKVGLFMHEDRLAYTTTGRSGQYIENGLSHAKIISIEIVSPGSKIQKDKEEEKYKKFINRVINSRYDDVTWSNLKDGSLQCSRQTFYSISKIFNSYEMDMIKRAFENKEKLHLSEDGAKRDYSVETKMCEDGIFRAWFTSEEKGGGRESCYLLLNPTTAVHCEDD